MAKHEPAADPSSRSRRALHAVRSHVRPGSFPALLATIATLYVLNGVAVSGTATEALVTVARLAVFCASIYVLSGSRLTMWVAVVVSAAAMTFEFHAWPIDPRLTRMTQDAISAAFLLWILTVVLRDVFRSTTSERDAVVGALCGFLVILTMFARLHGLVEAAFPGAYRGLDDVPVAVRPDQLFIATFQYFSTITLTTVGFGDIVPAVPLARLVTGLEAIVGQLYLAVVIATLVGRAAVRRA